LNYHKGLNYFEQLQERKETRLFQRAGMRCENLGQEPDGDSMPFFEDLLRVPCSHANDDPSTQDARGFFGKHAGETSPSVCLCLSIFTFKFNQKIKKLNVLAQKNRLFGSFYILIIYFNVSYY
jgi:hypothetical protein